MMTSSAPIVQCEKHRVEEEQKEARRDVRSRLLESCIYYEYLAQQFKKELPVRTSVYMVQATAFLGNWKR